jgi:ribosomal protein L7Ae-like RNA K-turn-binding protein
MIEDKTLADIRNLLGLTMKAGILVKGQDSVRTELKKGSSLLVLLACDHSRNVASMIEGYRKRGRCEVLVIEGLGRARMEKELGTGSTQILGLPRAHGLTVKIRKLVAKGAVADEQDKNI